MSRVVRLVAVVLAVIVGVWTFVRRDGTPVDACMGSFAGYPALVRQHLRSYPDMQIEDVYKLAHQALAGPGHAAPSLEQADAWLMDEIAGLEARAGDVPVSEPAGDQVVVAIRPDSSLLRVHLRPFVARGGDPADLARDFVAAARATEQDADSVAPALAALGACLASSDLPFDRARLLAFFDERIEEGAPAIHHSDTYTRLYRPAYRLVLAGAPSLKVGMELE